MGYDLLVYPFVAIWLAVFYFFYSMLGFVWSALYFILAVCVLYLMLTGASTVAIGIFLGLMTLPIWSAGGFG
ncbi:hypothetical protein C446_07502 [Halobiforma nitratireducens JCM 10879]|uniref:Uncharacterized protein n=1 Tax=Halobiforma nitratireducens JCM 10879 TaxID=1227454 RepID=M0M353_9EURY|nr:hypothetical protein C446_07502 [Halobiforma nitratireducens JCM 10879]